MVKKNNITSVAFETNKFRLIRILEYNKKIAGGVPAIFLFG